MIILLIATNATGAVTALGDTLFPVQPGVPTPDHFLAQLRIVHPIVAMISVLLVGGALFRLMQISPLRLLKSSLHALAGQAALGFLNIALSAPSWMQILHLLAAQVVWILIFLVVLTLWGGQS
jgi:protoheme IX farnesyltransferase